MEVLLINFRVKLTDIRSMEDVDSWEVVEHEDNMYVINKNWASTLVGKDVDMSKACCDVSQML